MAICYVDGVSGNDGYPGTITQPKKTYGAARTLVAGATPQIIVILRGYFNEGNYGVPSIPSGQFQHNICLGQTIFDGGGTMSKFSSYETQDGVIWTGAIFKNYTPDHIVWVNNLGATGHHFFNCSFINDLGGTVRAYSQGTTTVTFWQCTFKDIHFQYGQPFYSCICDAACSFAGAHGVAYNATDDSASAWRGTGGWSTNTYPPPWTDESGGDYSFDSGATYFSKYRTEGQDGGQVGASFLGGMYYNTNGSGIGLYDHVLGAWENDTSYYDDSFQQVVVSSSNQNIDFTDDDGSFTAVVAATTYTDGAALATAIQAAFNATASTQTYTCTFSSSTMRYTITNTTGALLSLLWTTTSNSIGDDIGFDTSTDDTGALSYTSDDAVTVGGVAGTTRVIFVGNTLEMDMGLEPSATSARGLGPVFDFGRSIVPSGLIWMASESGTSVVDNSQATSTREIEVSGNSGPTWTSPEIGWTLVARGADMSLASKRYWRQRAVLRTNGTP